MLPVCRLLGVPASPDAEAKLLLDSIQRTLKEAGLTMNDLVFVTVYGSDVTHDDAFNKVYRTYFKKDCPACIFIGAGELPYGARFEMQGIERASTMMCARSARL